jgi:hypothetical protein
MGIAVRGANPRLLTHGWCLGIDRALAVGVNLRLGSAPRYRCIRVALVVGSSFVIACGAQHSSSESDVDGGMDASSGQDDAAHGDIGVSSLDARTDGCVVNACGGCGVLIGPPGTRCAADGRLVCTADRSSTVCRNHMPSCPATRPQVGSACERLEFETCLYDSAAGSCTYRCIEYTQWQLIEGDCGDGGSDATPPPDVDVAVNDGDAATDAVDDR